MSSKKPAGTGAALVISGLFAVAGGGLTMTGYLNPILGWILFAFGGGGAAFIAARTWLPNLLPIRLAVVVESVRNLRRLRLRPPVYLVEQTSVSSSEESPAPERVVSALRGFYRTSWEDLLDEAFLYLTSEVLGHDRVDQSELLRDVEELFTASVARTFNDMKGKLQPWMKSEADLSAEDFVAARAEFDYSIRCYCKWIDWTFRLSGHIFGPKTLPALRRYDRWRELHLLAVDDLRRLREHPELQWLSKNAEGLKTKLPESSRLGEANEAAAAQPPSRDAG